MSKIPEPVTIDPLPESVSMSGKNAFYHYCDAWNGRQNYGCCRFALKAFDEDRLTKTSMCYGPIKMGTCNAIAMREAEFTSERSLYFIDRVKQIEENKARIASRQIAATDDRVSISGVGSLLGKRPINAVKKEHAFVKPEKTKVAVEPRKKDMDQLIDEGSRAMETALSNANKGEDANE